MVIRQITYFLFVFIPLSFLFFMGVFLDENKTTSERERRTLATKPDNFFEQPQEFETYLSDHIRYRDFLIDIYFNIGVGIDLGTKKTLIGKNGWLFQNEYHDKYNLHNLLSYANRLDFTKDELNTIVDNLLKVKKFCDKHHIRFYLMVPPDKHRVYARYMPSYLLRENRPSLSKRLSHFVSDKVSFVPLEDEFLKQSTDESVLLHYKTESHWSEDGAYLAYQLLMEKIKKDFPDIVIAKPEDFHVLKQKEVFSPYLFSPKYPRTTKGNLRLSGLPEDETLYTHYALKKDSKVDVVWNGQFKSSRNPSKPYRVYIIGDSYSTYMHVFLMQTFGYVRAYQINAPMQKRGIHFNIRQKEILNDKIDILIFAISDLKLHSLLRVF